LLEKILTQKFLSLLGLASIVALIAALGLTTYLAGEEVKLPIGAEANCISFSLTQSEFPNYASSYSFDGTVCNIHGSDTQISAFGQENSTYINNISGGLGVQTIGKDECRTITFTVYMSDSWTKPETQGTITSAKIYATSRNIGDWGCYADVVKTITFGSAEPTSTPTPTSTPPEVTVVIPTPTSIPPSCDITIRGEIHRDKVDENKNLITDSGFKLNYSLGGVPDCQKSGSVDFTNGRVEKRITNIVSPNCVGANVDLQGTLYVPTINWIDTKQSFCFTSGYGAPACTIGPEGELKSTVACGTLYKVVWVLLTSEPTLVPTPTPTPTPTLTPTLTPTPTVSSCPTLAAPANVQIQTVRPAGAQAFLAFVNEADINGDGVIDGADASVLVSSWGKSKGETGFNSSADLNSDDKVNAVDASILVSNWSK